MELSLFVLEVCFTIIALLCYPMSLKGNPNESPFPSTFLFGTASSSYQFEGAFLSDGKGLNNWDVFTHKPGNIMDGSNGDIAVDHYHRYQEDLTLMQHIGVSSYRFSISWARILPKGRYGSINKAGISHYNKLINTLLLIGIQPFVSLTHYDIPQELENRYGAWLSPQVQEDFKYYADICFKYFGDRVKYWTTFNEPNVAVIRGYRSGIYPPSRCSISFGNCSSGNSEKEPLVAAHNLILSHAAAVDIYKTRYQKRQGGSIGIVMNAVWYEPMSNSLQDKQAAERAQAFYMNWFLDPIIRGKYPAEMQEILGSILPVFSNHEQNKLKSTGLDFIGINHYTSFYIRDCLFSVCEQGPGNSKTEGFSLRSAYKNGVSIGEPTALDWLFVHPQGMEKVITYIKERYNNIPMFITENGFCENDKLEKRLDEESLNDVNRVDYISGYLDAIAAALRKGADVRGYFLWSLLDNFEWTWGFTIRFGLYHVESATLKRTIRRSAIWYKQFIANHTIQKNSKKINNLIQIVHRQPHCSKELQKNQQFDTNSSSPTTLLKRTPRISLIWYKQFIANHTTQKNSKNISNLVQTVHRQPHCSKELQKYQQFDTNSSSPTTLLKRTPRRSAIWYKQFIANHTAQKNSKKISNLIQTVHRQTHCSKELQKNQQFDTNSSSSTTLLKRTPKKSTI